MRFTIYVLSLGLCCFTFFGCSEENPDRKGSPSTLNADVEAEPVEPVKPIETVVPIQPITPPVTPVIAPPVSVPVPVPVPVPAPVPVPRESGGHRDDSCEPIQYECDKDCEDDNPCTINTCVDHECQSTPILGCAACETSTDCNDNDICTTNLCIDNICRFELIPGCSVCTTPDNCNEGGVCTIASCVDNRCFYAFDPACPCGDTFPVCGGVCPIGSECLNNGTSCSCVARTPCEASEAPLCGGFCASPTETCVSDGDDACFCEPGLSGCDVSCCPLCAGAAAP